MKQLKIEYILYDQHGNQSHESTFETTYYDELPPNIVKSALSLLQHSAGDGWYAITDISTTNLTGNL